MLPACNHGAGANIHIPDVCLTPPGVPVPYVDVGLNAAAVSFIPHVFIRGMNAHNLMTVIPVTLGDDAGVLHWTVRGFSAYVQGNPIVSMGKLPGVYLTCRTIGNKGNAGTGLCAVPSAVNVFYTLRREPEPAAPSLGSPGRDAPGSGAPSPEVATPEAMDALLPASGPEAARLCEIAWDAETAVLVVRPRRIARSTPLLVRRALGRHPARSVVLDLRANPGGDLDAAVRLVELFVARGTLAGWLVDGRGVRRPLRTWVDPAFEGPLDVLVDGTTGSAAEVVAAALQDAGRAAVIGERTWGKGTVQAFVPGWSRQTEGEEELATVARVERASGAPIDGTGVTPCRGASSR